VTYFKFESTFSGLSKISYRVFLRALLGRDQQYQFYFDIISYQYHGPKSDILSCKYHFQKSDSYHIIYP
jgi:hypothetical protein